MADRTRRNASMRGRIQRLRDHRPRRNAFSSPSGLSINLGRVVPNFSDLIALSSPSGPPNQSSDNEEIRRPLASMEITETQTSSQTPRQIPGQGWQASGSSAQPSRLDGQQNTAMTSNETNRRAKKLTKHEKNLKKFFSGLRGETGTESDVEGSSASEMDNESPVDEMEIDGLANDPTSSRGRMKGHLKTQSKPEGMRIAAHTDASVSRGPQSSPLPHRKSLPIAIPQSRNPARRVGSTVAEQEVMLSRTEQMMANQERSPVLSPGNPKKESWLSDLTFGRKASLSSSQSYDGPPAWLLYKKPEKLAAEEKKKDEDEDGDDGDMKNWIEHP
ncbi:hypothetical protein DSL72_000473 [Monilinia vaccinii-corymbosi]|uniref:Uncharacterized protein n=1 Tax=Monilinia vaccinii-corymbosi TaxID=61207 RepID=A0A8A3NZ22_9HELO|nr:hypothetical protein DSL72_000473 [Monilinia vaccinii-corymbosi]